jgi:uncharacterized protein involved in exopolysaccharide biosynthesis
MSAGLIRDSCSTPSPTPRELAATLFRHSKLVAISFGIILLGAMLYALFFSPRYESHFIILVRRGRSEPMVSPRPPSAVDFTRPEITEEELNSEVELLRDPDLLRRVVQMAAMIPAETSDSQRPAAVEWEARKLGRRLNVEAAKKSNIIQVSYRDSNPKRAARVLAALSTLYVRKHTSLHRPAGEIQFFEQQTAESEKRLHQSEAEVVRFTNTRGVAAAALERDIALQKLGDAEAAYRQMDQDRVETERRIAALREQLASFPSRSVTAKRWADNPELLEKLKSRLLELQLKRTELLTRYEPSYRLVQEVDREIEEARRTIAEEAVNPVRDETTDKDPNYEWARMELEKAQVQSSSLRARQSDAAAQIASLRTLAQQMQSDSIDQQALLRTAKAEEDNYLLYLRKREEARIGDALDEQQILNVAVVEPPVIPALPVHSALFYFLLAFGTSSAVSVGAAFAAEYFDPTIRTPNEARSLLEVPVLAWLPNRTSGTQAPALSAISRPKAVVQ